MRSRRSRPTGFIARCLPSAAERPPAEPGWIHEIKHRDHRVMARRSSAGVRLFTRNGLDWSERYPAITMAVGVLRCRSCLIDGQAVACNEDEVGLPRGRENVVLFAFDLLELDGRDLRREPIETRKSLLAKLLEHAKPRPAAERGHGGGGRRRIPLRLRAGPRGHRVQAPRLVLPLRPLARLDRDEEAGLSLTASRQATVAKGERLPGLTSFNWRLRTRHGNILGILPHFASLNAG
jgi:ATP dependent DNA ligase domain